MAIECPRCHTGNPSDSVYCKKCGAPLHSRQISQTSPTETLEIRPEELTRGSIFAGRYEIIEELGSGGMGKVYRAEDTKIKEDVALKVIKPEIATDKKTIDRFSNELKLARKIRHKNVCQMYHLGEDNGTHFITMEYVPGEDLKSMIRMSGQMSGGTAIKIAKQVCAGLAEAHKFTIVHRDLKPSNIMIDKDGNARIMDFGIARSVSAEEITEVGSIIGTPEYMSPEQVEGMELDQRSDIYSLGITLYEMVTGKLPYKGNTPLSVALQHKTGQVPDPRNLNAQITKDLSRVVLKCLRKDPGRRFQSAHELLAELNKIERDITSEEPAPPVGQSSFRSRFMEIRKKKILETLAAFAGGGVVIVEFSHHILVNHYGLPHQIVDLCIVTLVAALICTLAWRWFGGTKGPRKFKVEFILIPLVVLIASVLDGRLIINMLNGESHEYASLETVSPIIYENSIAVLPVKDLSPQRDQESLCNAMHDDIITKLRLLVPHLRVVPKDAMMRYANTNKRALDVGFELNVRTILESTLRTEGEDIRMDVWLKNVEDGSILWPHTYEEKSDRFFEIQDDICQSIASKLRVHLEEEQIQFVKTREPSDIKAKESYGWGEVYEKKYMIAIEEKDDEEKARNFEEAVKKYQEALNFDTNYALAYWKLGNIYQLHFVYDGEDWRDYDSMMDYYKQAYEINPNLSEANSGLGWAHFFKENLERSHSFFKKAIELDRLNPSINFNLGSFLRSIGLYYQAIEFYSRAITLDPSNVFYYVAKSNCHLHIGNYEEALKCIEKAFVVDENNLWCHFYQTQAFIMMDKFDEAEAKISLIVKINPEYPEIRTYRALISAVKGNREEALSLINGMESYGYTITSVYSVLGMKDKAIEYIEQAIEMGFRDNKEYLYTYLVLKNNPFYKNLHGDPRFKEIIKKEKGKYEARVKQCGRF
jgi:serine/threonine-protein kinase